MPGRSPRQFDGIDDDVVDLGERCPDCGADFSEHHSPECSYDEDDLGIGDDDAESEEPDDDEADRESLSFFRVQE